MENLPENPNNIRVIVKPKPPLLKYGIYIVITLVILLILAFAIIALKPAFFKEAVQEKNTETTPETPKPASSPTLRFSSGGGNKENATISAKTQDTKLESQKGKVINVSKTTFQIETPDKEKITFPLDKLSQDDLLKLKIGTGLLVDAYKDSNKNIVKITVFDTKDLERM